MYHPQLQSAPPPTFVEHFTALSYALTDHGVARHSPLAPPPVVPVQTLRFDDQQELLWSGNVYGHMTSYYCDQLTKYTSFSVGANDPVLQILTGDFGVLALLKDELKLRNRRGIPEFSYNSSTFKDMVCMSKLPSNLILMGGLSNNLIEFDLERVKQLRSTELDSKEVGCCIIRQHPKFVCCADIEGRITLRNTNNLAISRSFKTHSGQIADFDVHGNYLVTCGYPTSRPTPDRFLMVYDLRTFKLVTPIQSLFPPALIKFIPAFTSKFCLASSMGQFQLLDVAAGASENCTAFTHQVQLQPESSLTCVDVSTTGQAIGFGDDFGLLHLFGANNSVAFNHRSKQTEFPDTQTSSLAIDANDFITPLTSVLQEFPYNPYEKNSHPDAVTPLSDPSNDSESQKSSAQFRRTPQIDPKILESIINRSDVGYAPNPYKSLGRLSYIRGRVGVVGATKPEETDADNANVASNPDGEIDANKERGLMEFRTEEDNVSDHIKSIFISEPASGQNTKSASLGNNRAQDAATDVSRKPVHLKFIYRDAHQAT